MTEIIIDQLVRSLKNVIQNSSRIFIVGHNEPDFDSIAASIGIYYLCKNKVETYIVIKEEDYELERGVRSIKQIEKDRTSIINMEQFKQLYGENSTLIILDTNKADMIPVRDYVSKFKRIFIIDHHAPSEKTLDCINKYILKDYSSASEIVASILHYEKTKCPREVRDYLLAGIILDTKRYMLNTTKKTYEVSRKLIEGGANNFLVNKLFMLDFEEDKKINNLLFNGTIMEKYDIDAFTSYNVAYIYNQEYPDTVYRREQIAKTADKMLNYSVDAVFAIGYLEDGSISISARSRSSIDVGKVMQMLNGGGTPESAGTRLEGMTIEESVTLMQDKVQKYLSPTESLKIYTYKKEKN